MWKNPRDYARRHFLSGTASQRRASFTLIELLIVIAIIAVLATVVILALNPAQLLAESRDSNRLSDMKTLNQAISLYAEDVGGNMGNSSTTYVSVPDPAATSSAGTDCSSLGLPALPTGDVYHCVGPQYLTKVNGNGWIPIDFQSASYGSPLGSLPIDPVNSTSTGLYYTYTYGGGNSYELTAPCEATKDQKGGACGNDGGVSSLMDEAGTDLSLAPPAVIGRASTYAELTNDESALVGYWKLDEGSGSTAIDSTGNGNDGTWHGAASGTSGYYSPGLNQTWAGYFNGSNNYIGIPTVYANQQVTIAVWTKAVSTSSTEEIVTGTSADQFRIQADGNLDFLSRSINPIQLSTVGLNLADGNWHFLTAISDGTNASIYVDGVQKASSTGSLTQNGWNEIGTFGGGTLFFGSMDGLRIYDRALSASEIAAIYNAEK